MRGRLRPPPLLSEACLRGRQNARCNVQRATGPKPRGIEIREVGGGRENARVRTVIRPGTRGANRLSAMRRAKVHERGLLAYAPGSTRDSGLLIVGMVTPA